MRICETNEGQMHAALCVWHKQRKYCSLFFDYFFFSFALSVFNPLDGGWWSNTLHAKWHCHHLLHDNFAIFA